MMNQEPPEFPRVFDTADYFLKNIEKYSTPLVTGSYISCGVTTIWGLSYCSSETTVNKILKERAKNEYKKLREAFVIFSDIDHIGSRGGNALYQYIKKNNLGNIMEFGPRMNPNTGNMIKLWVWEPPHASLDPSNKHMPVYGMSIIQGPTGTMYVDKDDPRAQDTRFPESSLRGA